VTLIPILNSILRSPGTPWLRSAITACTTTAHSTASTTEGNSRSTPSPVVLASCAPVFHHESIGNLAVFAKGTRRADLVEAHET
jgi:hypothetical protein